MRIYDNLLKLGCDFTTLALIGSIFSMHHFEIHLDHKQQLVKVTVLGEIKQLNGEKIITAARQNAAEHDFDILYDIRRATTNVSFVSWFNLPRKLEIFKAPTARHIRAAILASPDDPAIDEYKFYETVVGNLGFRLRVFFEEADALEWLKKNIL